MKQHFIFPAQSAKPTNYEATINLHFLQQTANFQNKTTSGCQLLSQTGLEYRECILSVSEYRVSQIKYLSDISGLQIHIQYHFGP